MILLVPLSVWAATGSRIQAWRALKGYGAILLVLLTFAAVAGVIGAVAAVMS